MSRPIPIAFCCLFLVGGLAWWATPAQGPDDGRFDLVPAWPQLPGDLKLGQVTGIATDGKGQVYVFHRAARPILVLDAAGKLVRSWGDGQVKTAHGIRLDPEGNVWTTDLGHHTVIKYDPQGNVLLTLGRKGQPGVGTDQFNKPADVAFGAGGEVFVADGYGNSRVIVFDRAGKYLRQWGKKGTGDGDFHLPHAIAIDREGQVFVGDRENDRVQVFDTKGKYLRQFPVPGGPYGLELTGEGRFFVAAGRANQVRWLDREGKVLAQWGMKGKASGDFILPHGVCIDTGGHVYVTEVDGRRVQKFRRRG